MKDYFAEKTPGFYITVVATALAIAGLVFYVPVQGATVISIGLTAAVLVVETLLIVLSGVMGNRPFMDLASSVCAVLMGAALVQSFTPQLDSIGFVVSGLYTFDQIFSFVLFVGFGASAMVLYIAASFMSLGKRK